MQYTDDREYGNRGFRARRAQRRRAQLGERAARFYQPEAESFQAGPDSEFEFEFESPGSSWLPSMDTLKRAVSWIPNPFGGSAPAPAPAAPSPAPAPPASAPAAPPSPYLKDQPDLQKAFLGPPKPIFVEAGWSSARKAIADTYNRVGGLIQKVASQLVIEPQAVLAVWKVESGGKTHTPNQAIIRFENHLLYKVWGSGAQSTYDQYFRHGGHAGVSGNSWENHQYRESTTAAWKPLHTGQQADEYKALALATRLAGQSLAVQCISIGGPQILCSNYKVLGYASAVDMYNAFQADERWHVLGFFDFCHNQAAPQAGDLVKYMRDRNWTQFATYYNGSGQVSTYGKWLSDAYTEAKQLPITTQFELEDEWAYEFEDGPPPGGGPPLEGAGDDAASGPDRAADASAMTADGHSVTISATVLQDILDRLMRMQPQSSLPPSVQQKPHAAVRRRVQKLARNSRRVGSVKHRRTGHRYPVFQGRTRHRVYNMVARRHPNGQHEILAITPNTE